MSQEENVEQEQEQPQPKSIYDVFETDEKLERDGVVFDSGFGKFRVAYAGNEEFAKDYAERMKPYAEANTRGMLEPKIHRRILVESYTKTVVKGWEGVVGRDGELLEFNEENCVRLLTELPRLFEMIRTWAGNFANYRKLYVESVAGNSDGG